jgi:hypothetical protein
VGLVVDDPRDAQDVAQQHQLVGLCDLAQVPQHGMQLAIGQPDVDDESTHGVDRNRHRGP